jgi:hypothetical protein
MTEIVEHHAVSGRDLTADEARQGVMLGHMRYVLGASMMAIVAIYAAMLFFGS